MAVGRKLVIVESPTKSRTIGGLLGPDYDVVSSIGHIRDLPQPSELPADMREGSLGKFAVDVENGFTPYYVVNVDKKKVVSDIKKRLKESSEVLLATDEDREGEAIAWHLLEVLKPKVPVKRLAFHEITPEGIERALAHPRDVDMELVEAQEARRVLDRLYGYEVSPVLWRKVAPGLSAGRVQSIALRLVVDRERERMAFVNAEYWDLQATFEATTGPDAGRTFDAKLTLVDGKRVATGRDFNDAGELTSDKVAHVTAATAGALASGLANATFSVTSVESKPYTRRPAAPFITSTLIQEASRKLRLGARDAMRVAQGLYERGYITYMRTDSPTLSGEAERAARAQAAELYGADTVADKPRVYATSDSNAQEAHEAIRPAGDVFKKPEDIKNDLRGDEFRMYDLIWKRTLASQMNDAKGTTSTVKIGAESGAHHAVEFSASGTIITFPGFLSAYEETKEKSRYDEDEAEAEVAKEKDDRLPQLEEGAPVTAAELEPASHTTSPPPRFTQGSMIKELEDRKFGRPSTYAATVDLIVARDYVRIEKQALIPNWIAFSIVGLLEKHFGWLIDYDFTADMELGLDRIAAGEEDSDDWLGRFYLGTGAEAKGRDEGLKALVEDLGEIDARAINTFELGDGINVRVGRYGPYVERMVEGEPERASVPDDLAPDELDVAKALELFATQGGDERELGTHPDTGLSIVAKAGRFGPYVTEVLPEDSKSKPKTASLFKTMQLETITLDDAVTLMSLPRVVGKDPESGEDITAQNGRYGPYLKKGTDSRSLETEDQLLTVTLEQALAIYAEPKRGRGRPVAPPLKELGVDPSNEKPIVIKAGRFGEYITDGETNVTIPRGETVEEMDHDRAVELLADKRAKGPAKKRAPAKRKPAAKKAPAKKAAAKK